MDVVMFKAMVDVYGGEEKVLGIAFNNSGRKMFTKEPFSYAKHLDETNGLFIFEEVDIHDIPYKVVKPVELVEGVILAENVSDIPNIDTRYVGV